jgi:hypothetical protein
MSTKASELKKWTDDHRVQVGEIWDVNGEDFLITLPTGRHVAAKPSRDIKRSELLEALPVEVMWKHTLNGNVIVDYEMLPLPGEIQEQLEIDDGV